MIIRRVRSPDTPNRLLLPGRNLFRNDRRRAPDLGYDFEKLRNVSELIIS